MHQKECLTLSYPSTGINPSDWLRFVQLDPFTRKWTKLGLGDDDLRALEIFIMSASDRAPVVRGSGGLRKITTLEGTGSNKGKRESHSGSASLSSRITGSSCWSPSTGRTRRPT